MPDTDLAGYPANGYMANANGYPAKYWIYKVRISGTTLFISSENGKGKNNSELYKYLIETTLREKGAKND